MTRNRVLWFILIVALTTPVLLAAFRGNEGLTVDVWGNSLVFAAAIATGNALVWSRRSEQAPTAHAPAGRR
jgi:hypothetical protein